MAKESKYLHRLNFGFSSEKKPFEALTDKLGKIFYLVLTVAGTVSLTYAGGFVGSALSIRSSENGGAWYGLDGISEYLGVLISHPTLHFVYGALLLIFGLTGTYKDYENLDKRNRELEKQEDCSTRKLSELKSYLEESEVENATLNGRMKAKHAQLVETWLNGAFSQLLKVNTHARVSIYYYYNDAFFILARYSPNGRIGRINKQKFALNQGVISKAYEHLKCHESNAPKHSDNPNAYKQYMMQHYGYKQEQLDTFNMKSCRYFGEAIREADSVIGIILYESENPEDLTDSETIDNIKSYHKNYWSHLCQFVRHGIEHDLSTKQHDNSINDKDALEALGGRKR
ncbi:hypothetical protein [Vibrio owensii]|uniref:hypothetical protein n=1 Tax=Vibrio owensii TaxID=696485 RepID=UPI002895F553|nr:conserved hypothetical protein [Vibrio owensii]